MADLLIKGMKMPPSCCNCECNILDVRGWGYCCLCGAEIENNLIRPDWCPLVEVPQSAQSVRHGHWQKSNPLTDTEECSVCGYNIPTDDFETPYCPWCGAKLEGDDNEID